MATYKLLAFGAVWNVERDRIFTQGSTDYEEYLAWVAAGNTPDPADVPAPAVVARNTEVAEAQPTARAYFLANPAAVAFIRQTPEQQAAAIDAMTLAQLKPLIKYMAVAVSALIKKEML